LINGASSSYNRSMSSSEVVGTGVSAFSFTLHSYFVGITGQMSLKCALISSAVRGTVGSGEGVLLPTNWLLTRGRDKIHDNPRSCDGG
jgi:hypothetical protein